MEEKEAVHVQLRHRKGVSERFCDTDGRNEYHGRVRMVAIVFDESHCDCLKVELRRESVRVGELNCIGETTWATLGDWWALGGVSRVVCRRRVGLPPAPPLTRPLQRLECEAAPLGSFPFSSLAGYR